jgi:hypothetical protein
MSGPEFAGGSSVVVRGSRRRANVLRAAGLENVTGAARSLSLTIPATILARADEMIE